MRRISLMGEPLMKQHILYRTLTAVFALCALVFAVLGVIAMIPPAVDTGLAVKETVNVSSSLISTTTKITSVQIQGTLINESDKEITVNELKIKVSDGSTEREIVLEGFKLLPRVTHPILYKWEDTRYFNQVNAVIATVDGGEEQLSNLTASMPFDFGALIFFAVCAVLALFAVHFGKQCYYLVQEDEIKKSLASSADVPTESENQ